MRKVILAENAGFCFGVKRAVDEALKNKEVFNKKIYTLGPLIHNNDVVEMLESNDIHAVNFDDISTLSKDDVVVIRSHGVSKKVYDELENRGLTIINATCPFVTNIQKKAKKYSDDGYRIVIMGDEKHPEVVGINGWCDNKAIITKNGDIDESNLEKVCLVSQTTEKKENWEKTLNNISNRSKEVLSFNTICSATDVRQKSADEISKQVQVMLVIGGKNSSNTTKLYEICKKNCDRTYYVENAKEIPLDLINDKEIELVGVTAGASTPDWVIKEVINIMENNNSEVNQLDLMNEMDRKLTIGEVIKVEVLKVDFDAAYVAIPGYKLDGKIPKNEFTFDKSEDILEVVKVGDEIKAKVLSYNFEGYVLLSRKEIQREEALEELKDAKETEKTLDIEITDAARGGLVAYYKGVRIFIPQSQISVAFVKDPASYVGKVLNVKILNLEEGNVIASSRIIEEAAKNEREDAAWGSINEGDVLKVKVLRFAEFGAFVDVKGLDGLIPLSLMSYGKVSKPQELLKLGEEVEAKIIALNREDNKLTLSIKDLLEDPWVNIEEKYPEGTIVVGKVVRIADFGAFVELEKGVDGLLHISQISRKKINHPSEVLKVNDVVKAKILSVDSEKKKIGLSSKVID
ncbi:bifunctional 4-hydroxy-3-methylbut-2-enyl diphosphate reductase/30S ribosomal protein S1 [Clostridium paridis]|uniref:4-hydroxy-3-methylbut-2-enyl diphosphate reductase n=1 Tax=Clostridium paridis TaxID=2803863 RepID=A0A937K1Z8_9CLOT|nr:bifunctional 4-hydroxy-3-methylbut-2-enyl diphosphate reductase/30S ribosomal protein S1 [Clostridium paridis]MBL4930926.1 bifunctional 4-hydroxy-3-methylbut-2-enyl diphosphate reductase/30S ribosomal protein S1 [Clostridium paridis]